MTVEAPRSSRGLIASLLIGAFWLGLALWFFARQVPPVGHAPGLDSDDAITQMMANAPELTPYSLYYWAQDRNGGWPYDLAWIIGRVSGHGMNAAELYWWMILWIVATAWPIRQLAGRWGWLGCAGVLGLWAIHGTLRRWSLTVCPPFTWELCSLIWAWWFQRRYLDSGMHGKKWLWPAGIFSLLTIWSSPLSAPFLAFAAVIDRPVATSAPWRKRWLLVLTPTAIGFLGEMFVIRRIHIYYSSAHNLPRWWTNLHIDFDHWGENIIVQGERILTHGKWIIVVVSTVTAWMAWRRIVQARRAGERGAAGDRFLVGASGMAWLNLGVVVFMGWARINGYSLRYMVPSWTLWVLSGTVGLAAALESLAVSGRRTPAWVIGAAGTAVFALLIVRAPRLEPTPETEARSRLSEELPRRAPGAYLLGCYWGTYVYSDAQAAHPVRPLIFVADGARRTEWNRRGLHEAPEVVVSQDSCPRTGSLDSPAEFLFAYGTLFELKTPRWLVDGPYGFSMYRNRSELLLPSAERNGRTMASGDLKTPEHAAGKEFLTIPLARPAHRVMVFFDGYLHAPQEADVKAEAVDAAGHAVPLQLSVSNLTLSVDVPDPAVAREVRILYARDSTDDRKIEDRKFEALAALP